METKPEFVRLNRRQRVVLERLKSFDGDPELIDKVASGSADVLGMDPGALQVAIRELGDIGYLTVLYRGAPSREDRAVVGAKLHSVAFCYRWEYFVNLVLPAGAQFLGGISGGLVVWMLTKVFSG